MDHTQRPEESFLRRMDVRFKMACMAFLSVAVLGSHASALVFLSFLCLSLWISLNLRFSAYFYSIRHLGFLLLIILAARSFTVSFSYPVDSTFISFDPYGALDGLIICWRLVIMVFLGVLWISTTTSSGIRSAVEWFFKPLPGISGKKVATMISLTVRFLPEILQQARLTSEAQHSRCIQNRKNPVYRAVKFSIPFLRRILNKADLLADAMESRCYSENFRPPAFKTKKTDWLILGGTSLFTGLVVLI